jgi:DNA-binding MarR family transcriptional regulator
MPDFSAIRVPDDFEHEFRGASRSAAEVAANLARTAAAFVAEIDRWPRLRAGLSAGAFQTLAILEGAGEPLAAHVIAEQLLVSSASMTSMLDTLERRGLVERRPHPNDRRKILVHLVGEAHSIVDEMLPVIHAVITAALVDLTEPERERLIRSMTKIWARLNEIADQPIPSPKSRRGRRGVAN